MKIGYLECFAGISGDGILGALVDAGLEEEILKKDLSLLPLQGYEIKAESVTEKGIKGTRVTVVSHDQKKHCHLADIEKIIGSGGLPDPVKAKSIAVFAKLAEAEAKVGASTPHSLHFPESGVQEAIIHVVGAVSGFWRLGIEKIYSSPVQTGSGLVECDRGFLPVPSPVVLELLKGASLYGGNLERELVTSTGAALLAVFCQGYGSLPAMKMLQTGYGAGTGALSVSNFLRLTIGVKAEASENKNIRFGGHGEIRGEEALMVEVNLDDMNPELYDYLIQILLEAGAMDVGLVPLQMKKNRPATMLKILIARDKLPVILKIVFRETTSIGLRTYPVQKYMVPYEIITVTGPWGPQPARVKVARLGSEVCNIAPEYEDCRRIAREQGHSLKEVYEQVKKAAINSS